MNTLGPVGQARQNGGWVGWVLARLSRESRPQRRLSLLERVSLGPRQSLSLVDVDGRRFLIATGPDGPPAFQALDTNETRRPAQPRRASW